MNNSIHQKFKKNILVLTIIITIVFAVINVSLYIINNNYLIRKVEEENKAFLLLTTHLINENDIDLALEYVEHYTHIHQVNIEVLDENQDMLYSSNVAHMYSSQYQIETLKGRFTIFIDNSNSVTVNTIETNTVYVNATLVIIFLMALLVLLRNNKRNSKEIDEDIRNVLKLINGISKDTDQFHHLEFDHIHRVITKYLENIDLLTEQKSMNMKGLAHDIKTPLTVIYSYFERAIQHEEMSEKEAESCLEAAVRINVLLHDIMEGNNQQRKSDIDISKMVHKKVEEYSPIFNNKNILIKTNVSPQVTVKWSEKDFERVIDNLISNAYYYSKNGSDFIINVTQSDQIFIEFISTPNNISDIDPNTIFQKGSRGALSDSQNSYGKGFGLYLCRLLLNEINGTITLDVKNGNVKFTIIL